MALVPSRFRDFVPARHPALRYGLALNDHGFFWESQQILEAVWAAAPQGGRERILLRACIQIAGANLKAADAEAACRGAAARRCAGELKALSLRKAVAGGDGFADGFPTAALAALLQAKLARPPLSKADWVKISTAGRT